MNDQNPKTEEGPKMSTANTPEELAVGGPGGTNGPTIDGTPPLPTPGFEAITPKYRADIDFSECDCEIPVLGLAEADIGPFHEQLLYCEECTHRFVGVVKERDGDD